MIYDILILIKQGLEVECFWEHDKPMAESRFESSSEYSDLPKAEDAVSTFRVGTFAAI